MNFWFIEHYVSSVADDCVAKKEVANSDLSTGYAFILILNIFGSLNTTVQVLQMIVLLKGTSSNL